MRADLASLVHVEEGTLDVAATPEGPYDLILDHAELIVDTRGKYRKAHPRVVRA